jgi:membrane-associated phospholipid phosphatase
MDYVMAWSTHVGDGLFMLLAFIVFLFIRIKTAFILMTSFLLASGITQLLKHTVFSEYKRPYFYLKNDDSFRTITDFTYHTEHSFPSGHATACFVLFTILAFHYQKKYLLQMVFILGAIFFSYTRVYLSQHFLQDIVAGSIIGVLVSQFIWDFLNPKLSKWDKPIRRFD